MQTQASLGGSSVHQQEARGSEGAQLVRVDEDKVRHPPPAFLHGDRDTPPVFCQTCFERATEKPACSCMSPNKTLHQAPLPHPLAQTPPTNTATVAFQGQHREPLQVAAGVQGKASDSCGARTPPSGNTHPDSPVLAPACSCCRVARARSWEKRVPLCGTKGGKKIMK